MRSHPQETNLGVRIDAPIARVGVSPGIRRPRRDIRGLIRDLFWPEFIHGERLNAPADRSGRSRWTLKSTSARVCVVAIAGGVRLVMTGLDVGNTGSVIIVLEGDHEIRYRETSVSSPHYRDTPPRFEQCC